jgi:hypothetical protein
MKEKIAVSQVRQGNNAGSENRVDAIMTPRPPSLIQWRTERYVPSFRGEGWGKRSLQSALCLRFGVRLHPEPHF